MHYRQTAFGGEGKSGIGLQVFLTICAVINSILY